MADSQAPADPHATAEREDLPPRHATILQKTDPQATDGIGYTDPEEPTGELEVHQDEAGEDSTSAAAKYVASLAHDNDRMYLAYFKRLIRHLTTDGVLQLMLRQVMTPRESEPLKGFFRDRQNAVIRHNRRAMRGEFNTLLDQQLTDGVERLRREFVTPDEDQDTIREIDNLTIEDLASLQPLLLLFRGNIVGGPREISVAPPKWWSSRTDRYYDRTAWTWLDHYYTEIHLNRF